MLPPAILKNGLDHGIGGGRSLRQPAMQLNVVGACQWRLRWSVDAIDRWIFEHDGGALRNGGQSDTLLRPWLQFTFNDGFSPRSAWWPAP